MKKILVIISVLFIIVSCQSEKGSKDIQAETKGFRTESKEQAITVHFKYGIEGLDTLKMLEQDLKNIIGDNGIGKYDYYIISDDHKTGQLHFTSTNADSLFNVIKPTLENAEFLTGAKAKLRYGPPADGVRILIKNL